MATPIENSLIIALHSLTVMLDARGALSKADFVEALKLETKGRPADVAAVLNEIARQYAPKEAPILTAIEARALAAS